MRFLKDINEKFRFSDLPIPQLLVILRTDFFYNYCLRNCSNKGMCELINNTLVCNCFEKNLTLKCDEKPKVATNMINCSSTNLTNEECPNGYESYFNTKIDACLKENCSNHGICYYKNSSTTCKCYYLYHGDRCEIEQQERKIIMRIVRITVIIAILMIFTLTAYDILLDLLNIFKYGLIKREKNKKKKKLVEIKHKYIA